jgi:PAS domain S-box-containing protein
MVMGKYSGAGAVEVKGQALRPSLGSPSVQDSAFGSAIYLSVRYNVAVSAHTLSKPDDIAARPEDARAGFELALWAASMGSFDWDLVAEELYVSEASHQIFGGAQGRIKADLTRVMQAVHPDDLPKMQAAVETARRDGLPYKVEHRIIRPSDGQTTWVMTAGAPVRDAAGKVVRIIGVTQDISAQKAAETQRETLVAELDHRVKNVLASVQSLALQSARKAPNIDTFLKTFAGRLKAMASAHTLLTATRWRGASVQNMVNAELGGLSPGQTRWEGPDVLLSPRATNALALALHELATNAVKYGALSSDAGRVDVRWWLEEGGFGLEWEESGGPVVSPPTRQGFGSTLLERVTGRELGGEVRVEFLATGVRAVMHADATALLKPVDGPVVEAAPPVAPAISGASAGDDTLRRADKVRGLRILIVEDSLLLSLELESGLTEAGAKVIGQAADVAEGLAMAALDMDCAVLDANLNGASVAPVARALEARKIPFIFATGYGDNQSAPQGFSAPFIRKPYDVTQVAAALAEVTGRA